MLDQPGLNLVSLHQSNSIESVESYYDWSQFPTLGHDSLSMNFLGSSALH